MKTSAWRMVGKMPKDEFSWCECDGNMASVTGGWKDGGNTLPLWQVINYGQIFGWFNEEPGVELSNLHGSLPTWNILWFYDKLSSSLLNPFSLNCNRCDVQPAGQSEVYWIKLVNLWGSWSFWSQLLLNLVSCLAENHRSHLQPCLHAGALLSKHRSKDLLRGILCVPHVPAPCSQSRSLQNSRRTAQKWYHRIMDSLRLEKTSRSPTHPHHAHWPCPSVPHPHISWIPPWMVTPPPPWAACANALPLFWRRNFLEYLSWTFSGATESYFSWSTGHLEHWDTIAIKICDVSVVHTRKKRELAKMAMFQATDLLSLPSEQWWAWQTPLIVKWWCSTLQALSTMLSWSQIQLSKHLCFK